MDNSLAIYLFHQGTNYYSYRFMGAQYSPDKTVFRVWAPNAMACMSWAILTTGIFFRIRW